MIELILSNLLFIFTLAMVLFLITKLVRSTKRREQQLHDIEQKLDWLIKREEGKQ